MKKMLRPGIAHGAAVYCLMAAQPAARRISSHLSRMTSSNSSKVSGAGCSSAMSVVFWSACVVSAIHLTISYVVEESSPVLISSANTTFLGCNRDGCGSDQPGLAPANCTAQRWHMRRCYTLTQ